MPAAFATNHLGSWTQAADTNTQRFAGAALYTLHFDVPLDIGGDWRLDLGKVCQSARVRLNGQDAGALSPAVPRRRWRFEGQRKRAGGRSLQCLANRIRDLDRRGVKWKNFQDINFVNLDYRPFDASDWPLTDSGLLGPVTLTPVKPAWPGSTAKN